jgi:hypothetical protein
MAALQKLADQFGPSPDELAQPIEELPESESNAFSKMR